MLAILPIAVQAKGGSPGIIKSGYRAISYDFSSTLYCNKYAKFQGSQDKSPEWNADVHN